MLGLIYFERHCKDLAMPNPYEIMTLLTIKYVTPDRFCICHIGNLKAYLPCYSLDMRGSWLKTNCGALYCHKQK
jgi:hypothetical protein